MPSIATQTRELNASPLDYDLPRELIAQHPVEPRDRSRLMVVDRADGSVRHLAFTDLPSLVGRGDLLVGNDSRVIAARLQARKTTGGTVELLLLPPATGRRCAALSKSSKRIRPGQSLELEDGTQVRIAAVESGGRCIVDFGDCTAEEMVERVGKVPLPPYIRHGEEGAGDRCAYQTVYARVPGSIAAPTAGLHFTPEVLADVHARGARFRTLTLHVGPGTFAPLRGEPADHVMGAEMACVEPALVREIEETRRGGGRVTAVGTTSVRTLESAADPLAPGRVRTFQGDTDLFIRPGFRFSVCDRVLTNFHLPRSTLLCLVMAFAGEHLIRLAYEQAVRERYRFYSYGDAMLIL